jgi:hypothetical protein
MRSVGLAPLLRSSSPRAFYICRAVRPVSPASQFRRRGLSSSTRRRGSRPDRRWRWVSWRGHEPTRELLPLLRDCATALLCCCCCCCRLLAAVLVLLWKKKCGPGHPTPTAPDCPNPAHMSCSIASAPRPLWSHATRRMTLDERLLPNKHKTLDLLVARALPAAGLRPIRPCLPFCTRTRPAPVPEHPLCGLQLRVLARFPSAKILHTPPILMQSSDHAAPDLPG